MSSTTIPPVYNIEAIKDYCYCPLYFHYKHNTPAGNSSDSSDLHYTCVKRVFYFIMYSAQGGSYPSKYEVKNAYNRLIKSTFKRIFAVRKNLDPGALKRGLEQCITMHEKIKQYKGKPVLINYNYTTSLNAGTITGTIDVAIERNRQLELIMLQQDRNEQLYKLVSTDLSVIAACIACRKLIKKPINAVGIYYIEQGQLESVNTNNKDIKTAEAIINSVISSINSKIYYPSAGRDCDKCTYRYLCASMKWLIN